MRKSVTIKFAVASIYILFTALLISGVSVKYASSKPTDGNVCDNLTGAAYGLCNAYINAMKCGTDDQNASDRTCQRVQANYEKITGELPPWDLCYNVTCNNGFTCVDGQCQCGGQEQCGHYEDCIDNECVDPCADLLNSPDDECPCDFESVPKTTACWGTCTHCTGNPGFVPCDGGDCSLQPGAATNCELAQSKDTGNGSFLNGMTVQANTASSPPTHCQFSNTDANTSCPQASFQTPDLTPEQLATCYCRLTQYANELAQVDDGIVIDSTQSPPYSCGTFTLP